MKFILNILKYTSIKILIQLHLSVNFKYFNTKLVQKIHIYKFNTD